VLPRRWWRNQVRLERYLRDPSEWRRVRFRVLDLPYNNIPELTDVSGRIYVTHQFRTPFVEASPYQLELFWRPRER